MICPYCKENRNKITTHCKCKYIYNCNNFIDFDIKDCIIQTSIHFSDKVIIHLCIEKGIPKNRFYGNLTNNSNAMFSEMFSEMLYFNNSVTNNNFFLTKPQIQKILNTHLLLK